jgi:hypothetical protein
MALIPWLLLYDDYSLKPCVGQPVYTACRRLLRQNRLDSAPIPEPFSMNSHTVCSMPADRRLGDSQAPRSGRETARLDHMRENQHWLEIIDSRHP